MLYLCVVYAVYDGISRSFSHAADGVPKDEIQHETHKNTHPTDTCHDSCVSSRI